ncbi:MAG: iron chelate uptake ABC transporter family permease subunit, partial [Cytophaga sp.]|uniref:iron chelate uptake ABC transporter family permease subunit n=1 Tax=Cytophaga sp. TaxID=29535 RepID=UPI003F7F99F8
MRNIAGCIAAVLFFIILAVIGTVREVADFPYLINAIVETDSDSVQQIIWFQIRLPRILLAFFTGAALGLSGYLMQVLVRNPLADPYVLGSSAGASLFAAVFYIWLAPDYASITLLLILTFVGAFSTNVLSIFLATVKGRI